MNKPDDTDIFGSGLVDPADRAAHVLDETLEDSVADEAVTVVDSALQKKVSELLPKEDVVVSDAEEVADDTRLITGPDRELIRVLMITDDRSIFVPGSVSQDRMQSYADLFDELHIIVLSLREHGLGPVRLAPNVWVYPTNSESTLRSLYDAYRIAGTQLSFTDGFRADLVSASNPFEAGLVAYLIGRRHHRAFQLALSVNPFDSSFKARARGNSWRRMIAQFILRRASGVRVSSEYLKTMLEKRYKKHLKGKIDVLPTFSDVSLFRDAQPSFDLHERYPAMKFIILAVLPLTKEARVSEALDVCAPTLRQYPTVGMVIVGDGPLRAELGKRALALGIQNQVVFEGPQEDIVSYYKTANLFLNTSGYEEYTHTLAEAAAAGLPVLTSNVGMAPELFEDGKNGFLCAVGDTACFSRRIGEFLSDNHLRLIFARDAQSRVFKIIDSNMEGYREAIQGGMEACVFRYAGGEVETTAA